MVFNRVRDPRYVPEAMGSAQAPSVLFVEIVSRARSDDLVMPANPVLAPGTIGVDLAGGHRMRISDRNDPEALVRLIRRLSM